MDPAYPITSYYIEFLTYKNILIPREKTGLSFFDVTRLLSYLYY